MQIPFTISFSRTIKNKPNNYQGSTTTAPLPSQLRNQAPKTPRLPNQILQHHRRKAFDPHTQWKARTLHPRNQPLLPPARNEHPSSHSPTNYANKSSFLPGKSPISAKHTTLPIAPCPSPPSTRRALLSSEKPIAYSWTNKEDVKFVLGKWIEEVRVCLAEGVRKRRSLNDVQLDKESRRDFEIMRMRVGGWVPLWEGWRVEGGLVEISGLVSEKRQW